MLKERETYTATKGVENEGYEFEVAMSAFYCFHLCYNNTISDFKIAIYDDQYHPFDDIVIDITTQVSEKYAIQLKHVKDKLVLNANHFGKNGKMVLSKYFKYDFTKSDHVVLLTNGVVNEEITVGCCHIKVKSSLSEMEKCLDTSSNQEHHIYEVSNEETSNKFTFYTSQKSRYDIDEEIRAKFKAKFFLNDDNVDGIVQKFKSFFQKWKKGAFKLDKEDIKMKITEILFYEHIVDYKPQFGNCVEKKTHLVQNILNSFNVTIVQDVDTDTLSSLCCFEKDKQELVEDGQKLLISDNSYRELAIILWRLKKFPLIVEVNAENENLVYDLINDIQHEDLSFILVGSVSRTSLKPGKIFENFADLQENTYFDETIEEFTLSIQGQSEISLRQLYQCNLRFLEVITTKELILMSKGNFVVGDTEEELPQPYIPRRLITTTLKINSIEHFPNDLFAICGCDQLLKQKLPRWRFWKFEEFVEKMSLGNSMPTRSVILCEETGKSFATCLKYEKRNVHCLKVVDSEHLQRIYSKEKSDHLRQFQIFPEDQVQYVLKNNINLVCARPGMGKMTMLKYLRRNSLPGYWTIKVDLQDQQFQLSSEQNSSFEGKFRDCFKEVRKISFFFYGIDNLQNDSLIKATEHIKKVAKDNFKVWVFSEDHLRDTLEKIFEVPPMDIEEFSEEEQQRYIQERLKYRNADEGLEKVLQSFKMLKNNDILGGPMHLYMLTEIFINDPKASMEEIFVLTDIYRYFIKTKYHHYLAKVSSDPDHHNQIIEDGIYFRTEQYKLAAISGLGTIYLNGNIQCDRNFLKQIGRIGDVVGIIFKIAADWSVIFTQQTYADYFAALWLASNYHKVRNIKEFILREDFKNILFMFNLEICRNHPAHIAVLYQNYELLRKFQAKLNELDPLGRSPLHLACFYGTKLPKLKISEEETALKFNKKQLIKEDTHTKRVTDFLMSSMIVDPYQTDKLFGWTLYDCAFSVLNLYVIQKLLKQLPQTRAIVLEKLKNLKEDFFTVVYYSLKFGYNDLFRLTSEIPSFKKALAMENCNGQSLLYLAVKSGNHDNVEVLLNNGAKANTITSTYNKRSVLHFAVENGHNEVVRLLLDRGAFPDIMDRYRNTPLHIASSKGIYQSAQLLLNYGSDVNFADNFGRTSLQLAATHGHLPILQLLLDHGASVDKCDKFGKSPLSCAQDKKHHNITSVLLREGATTPTTLNRRLSAIEYDEYTSYQLHWAAYTGQAERIEPLLQDGWTINYVDHFGRTPLYRAVTEKHFRIVEMFIDIEANVDIPDNNKVVPLCIAISNDDRKIISLLLKGDASVDVRDNFGYTPLHWAAMYGNVEIIKLLLGKTPDVDAVDNFGRKPVHCAVENGHCDAVSLLEVEESKLSEVARERLSFLQHYGNIVNEVNGKSKLTPFEEAIDSGNYILVKKFLNQIDDLNKINDHGHTILHRAVIKRHRLTVEFLLEKGVKLDTLDKCNSSVLHWAAMIGDAGIVQLLRKWNVEVNVIDNFGYSPLAVAAMNGHLEVLSLLLKDGGDTDVVDKCGNSPLDWACKKGYIQCVEVLLKNGAVAKSLQGRDLLDLAKEQRTFLKRAALF